MTAVDFDSVTSVLNSNKQFGPDRRTAGGYKIQSPFNIL